MFNVGTAAKCCEFKRYVFRLDSMLRESSELRAGYASYWCDKHGCSDRCKNHGCGLRKKPEGTSSATFGSGTAAKCCELSDVPSEFAGSRTQERENPRRQISVRNLKFSFESGSALWRVSLASHACAESSTQKLLVKETYCALGPCCAAVSSVSKR